MPGCLQTNFTTQYFESLIRKKNDKENNFKVEKI